MSFVLTPAIHTEKTETFTCPETGKTYHRVKPGAANSCFARFRATIDFVRANGGKLCCIEPSYAAITCPRIPGGHAWLYLNFD